MDVICGYRLIDPEAESEKVITASNFAESADKTTLQDYAMQESLTHSTEQIFSTDDVNAALKRLYILITSRWGAEYAKTEQACNREFDIEFRNEEFAITTGCRITISQDDWMSAASAPMECPVYGNIGFALSKLVISCFHKAMNK